ncbi:MAG TPA: ParB N-terminal domain-containing protein, partial [Chitinophagaceae bacterium]|nr:ParB N-terminal domain-containing protein [Chitinophagaceae bacterium]
MNTPKQNKDALGKGIRSLLQSIDADLKTSTGHLKNTVVESVTSVNRIPVDDIEANPKQPRHDFDEQSLHELASSVKRHDIIQPITVSKLPTGKFRLI